MASKRTRNRKASKPQAENGAWGKPTGAAVPAWLLGPVAVGLAATLMVWATLAPEQGGPTATCDELYHVVHGKQLVGAWLDEGFGFFQPENIRKNFAWRAGGPPVQAPLGHWLLGWSHWLFDPEPHDPNVVVLVAARFAPGLALGVTAALIGLWMARHEGPIAGTTAAAAVVLVPRVFGHAHLAALDTFTALFCVAAVVAVAEAEARGGQWCRFALAGIVWGLACLTRLHGVLLVVPVAAYLIWRLRLRAAWRLPAWFASGVAVLFAGWPWLWLAPLEHLRLYLGSGVERASVHVFYAGRVWDDAATPWHYPWVMFAAVLPLGLLILGGLGLWMARNRWRATPGLVLVPGTLVGVLLLFSLPGVPVYDGERLFLPAYPLWAVFVGLGAKWAVEHRAWNPRRHRLRVGLLVAWMVLQGTGLVVFRPAWLSHYSLLVGSLAGAERLGFEVNYWGDGLAEPVLAEGARRAESGRLAFGPGLAAFQTAGIQVSSPSVLDYEASLVGWEGAWKSPPPDCRYAVFYHRKADLAQIPQAYRDRPTVAEYNIQGVWLARVVELPTPGEPPGS